MTMKNLRSCAREPPRSRSRFGTVSYTHLDVYKRQEYNGYNTYELARKWKLSDAYVRQIVKDKAAEIRRAPPDGQLTFDDLPQKIGRNSSPEQSIKDKV